MAWGGGKSCSNRSGLTRDAKMGLFGVAGGVQKSDYDRDHFGV